jgi:hypothetical protein
VTLTVAPESQANGGADSFARTILDHETLDGASSPPLRAAKVLSPGRQQTCEQVASNNTA